MQSAEDCLSQAMALSAEADGVRDPNRRAALLMLAEGWLDLAQCAERQDASAVRLMTWLRAR